MTATPAPMAALAELAANAWTTWNPDARALFARLDADRYAELRYSAPALLASLGSERVARAVADEGFAREVFRVHGRLRRELEQPGFLHAEGEPLVAYLCCEFGVDESLPLYSGGLGILAGDHLKSASDLGVPLVGVGLFYRHGYFRQGLDPDGWQTESYLPNDPERMGLVLERGEDGAPLEVEVEMPDVVVRARIWRLAVGRVPLYLLDTDVAGATEGARAITGTLYGGDRERRIRQELLLGVGGARALAALGLTPRVFHLNEGHSAFVSMERLRAMVAEGADRDAAFRAVRDSTVFTTHTPVPAGNEVFDPALVLRYLGPLRSALGLSEEELLAMGRASADDAGFGMTPLALRTSRFANGVSKLHGEVAREMWQALWPDLPADEVPIEAVTNGVHPPTWIASAMADEDVDDAALWAAHRDRARALVRLVDDRLGKRSGLDAEALTIGFARRFATYKRADLVLSDPDRLAGILARTDRPVQVVFAGKAHPADQAGKRLIHKVVQLTREARFAGRVVFLPDYDMEIARHLVQGVDVWLNTPRRPLEASGTSGMKAAMNGVLNVSVADGWWAEGFAPELGWVIEGADEEAEAREVYRLLEDEVVPLFYARSGAEPPVRWVSMMRSAMAGTRERFASGRMVREYLDRAYAPVEARARRHASGTPA